LGHVTRLQSYYQTLTELIAAFVGTAEEVTAAVDGVRQRRYQVENSSVIGELLSNGYSCGNALPEHSALVLARIAALTGLGVWAKKRRTRS
jgi:hypothetical protein